MSNEIAETIVAILIDKLISNVCRDHLVKEIYSNFNNHCDKYIMKILKPYLYNSFLFHENGLDDLEKNKNQIFYNSILPKKTNSWVSFTEPNSCTIDRFASNNNKLNRINVKKNENLRLSLKTNAVSEQKEFEKKSNNKIIKKPKIKIKLKDIWKKPNNKEVIKNNFKRNILIDNKNVDIKEDNKIIDEKKDYILEITGTYIPYEKNEKINILLNNTEENDLLRKEMEQKIIEKEEMLKNERDKKNDKFKEYKLMNKQFNVDKLTFDSNGNIIKLHLPLIDSFNQDFILSKHKIKDEDIQITTIKSDNQERKSIKSINSIKSTIKNNKNKLKIIDNNLIITSDKIKQTNSNLKLEPNNKNELIEYNPNDKMDDYFKYSRKNKEKNKELIYSGSNFDKISPEIGVIISKNNNDNSIDNEKEKNNKKMGGFDYIKKYNKPSMNEISNFLLSHNSKINNEQISSFFNYDYSHNSKNINVNLNDNKTIEKNNSNSNKFNIDNNDNYIGYKEEFNDNNNPLFHDAFKLNEESQNNPKNYNNHPLIPLKKNNMKSFSNENIFIPKKVDNSRMKKNISYQINPLFNRRKILINNKSSFQDNNINIHFNTKDNYLSSLNTILLSENFNNSNLKSIFTDGDDNNAVSRENKNKSNVQNNNVDIKFNSIDYENNNGNINVLYPLKKIKFKKDKLPAITEINNNNNIKKYIFEQKYINKFNLNIIKNKNWGNDGNDNIYDLNFNDKNGYKEHFLRERNNFLKASNKAKIIKNNKIDKEKIKQRNTKHILYQDYKTIKTNKY